MPISERLNGALPRFVLSLVVGAAGGALFYWARMPLPFMLGPMLACMLASLARLPLGAPAFVRPPMSAVIGTMIGTSFGPHTLANVDTWPIPIAGLSLFLIACALCGVFFFRFVMNYDLKTAYFAGMPGGLVDMVLLGEAAGADGRKIALVHTTRIAIVTFAVPLLSRWLGGAQGPAGSRNTVSILAVSPDFFLWFAATAVAGIGLGFLLRLPARYFLGPMSASAVLHMTGVSDFKLPSELVSMAQIVLGVTIGCRFAGMGARTILATLSAGLGSTGMMLVVTGLFAWAIGALSDIHPLVLFLAYSPGGIAEMGMVALALNLDTALVVTHHVARIFMVGFGGPLFFQLARVVRHPRP
ncbi:AbrB family transcriptional regulator [Rhizobium binxianense]